MKPPFDLELVWGEPSPSLPQRGVQVTELEDLAQQDDVHQVRIPKTGYRFLNDTPGPAINYGTGTISEFFVIKTDGSCFHYKFGWPEPTVDDHGIEFPETVEEGIAEGYVHWWKDSVNLNGVRILEGAVHVTDVVWDVIERNSEPLTDSSSAS